jgi:hypothetical protein
VGKGKTILAVSGALLASAMRRWGVEVDVMFINEPDPMPDFKEVRTDPAYRREKTHPKSFRKNSR